MNAEDLLRHYDRIADAPEAIVRLRRLVLDLAVRGKLVPQDPEEEPASASLDRIARKHALIERKARTRGAHVNDKEVSPSDAELPPGWSASRLARLVTILNGRAYKQSELLSTGTPVLRVGNLFTSDKWYYSDLTLEDDKYCQAGDLIFAWSASFGPFIWTGERVIYHYHIWNMPLHSEADLNKNYLFVFLLQRTRELKESGHGISMLHLTKESMERMQFAVPPLAEQRRIVTKVNELMELCDRLEAARVEREAARDRLTAASLARLNAPDPETFADDARFALVALPALTTRADQVKQLRQTLFSLAVRGKLVAQDSTDESASALLARLPEMPTPARFAKRSVETIRGDCGLSVGDPGTELPNGWIWVPLVRVAKLESGHTPSRNRPDWWGGDVPWIGLVDARIHNNGTIFDTLQTTNEDGLANSAARLLPQGTVCFSRTASVGYVVIMGRPMATSQDFVNWVPSPAITSRWLQLVMMAERPAIPRFGKGAVHQTIYYPAWLSMHIALPPLAEQARIVAKVDELMALCGSLEASLSYISAQRESLLQALLHAALTETA